jgi:hypothetical protein
MAYVQVNSTVGAPFLASFAGKPALSAVERVGLFMFTAYASSFRARSPHRPIPPPAASADAELERTRVCLSLGRVSEKVAHDPKPPLIDSLILAS